jgi:hypothetical protein
LGALFSKEKVHGTKWEGFHKLDGWRRPRIGTQVIPYSF